MHEPTSTPPAIAMTDLGLVWRYKRSIILATLVAAVLAWTASLFIKPVYEAEVNLQIGKAYGADLEDTFQVVGRLNSLALKSQYAEEFDEIRKNLIVGDPVDPSLKGNPSYIKILTHGRTRDGAVDLARRVAERIVGEHKPLYDAAREHHQEYERTLTVQIEESRKEVARMEESLRALEKNPSVGTPSVLLLQAQLEDRQTQIVDMAAKLRDARIQQTNQTRPTRMMAPPYALNVPIWPMRGVIVVVAAGLAFLVSVLMVVLGAQANRRL